MTLQALALRRQEYHFLVHSDYLTLPQGIIQPLVVCFAFRFVRDTSKSRGWVQSRTNAQARAPYLQPNSPTPCPSAEVAVSLRGCSKRQTFQVLASMWVATGPAMVF